MDKSVLMYTPNIIGYIRLILLFTAMFTYSHSFIILYLLSVSLDYFDGKAARYFGEESKLGACLDMITDRISTTVLCIKISGKKPTYNAFCMSYIFFDLLSHFLFFTSMIYGNIHHKTFDRNFLLRVYYNPAMLKIMCVGSEASFLLLYYLNKTSLIAYYLFLIPSIKTFFHVIHLFIGLIVLAGVGTGRTEVNVK